VVLNEFWATASTTYKTVVFSAMGLIAVGIILTIVGNTTHNQGLAVASLVVIGLGLVLHVVGMVVRGQQIRKGLKK
jgi:predicted membrane channel-forming protein YqfA (hemolysin III family)